MHGVQPLSRALEHAYTLTRAEMAEEAKELWTKDDSGEDKRIELPPLMDGVNCRAVLAKAQLEDLHARTIIYQKRKELDPEYYRKCGISTKNSGPQLRPIELAQYRLAPADEVLEKKVLLANCCLWVPVIPDQSVPDEPTAVSWRKWLFDHCHQSFLHPHWARGNFSNPTSRWILGHSDA